MGKIYITGTGRCGTTFLMKIFIFLEYDTGFTKEDYNNYIYKNCGAGLERIYYDAYYIIKNPLILTNICHIGCNKGLIKAIIIPIRNFYDAALSRVRLKNDVGGLWEAHDLQSQISSYNKFISEYIYYMTKYDINTIFLDFDRMTTDYQYLYEKLKFILDEKDITLEHFGRIFKEVSINN